MLVPFRVVSTHRTAAPAWAPRACPEHMPAWLGACSSANRVTASGGEPVAPSSEIGDGESCRFVPAYRIAHMDSSERQRGRRSTVVLFDEPSADEGGSRRCRWGRCRRHLSGVRSRGGRVRAGLMERSLDQCSEGNAINARRSSSACSSTWQTFGAIEVRRARTSVTVAGLGAVDLAEPRLPHSLWIPVEVRDARGHALTRTAPVTVATGVQSTHTRPIGPCRRAGHRARQHRACDDIGRGHHRYSAIVVLVFTDSWKSRRAWTPRLSDRPTRPRYTTSIDMTFRSEGHAARHLDRPLGARSTASQHGLSCDLTRGGLTYRVTI